MIISDIKDARDGDWIKASFRGLDGVWHAFEGIAWTHKDDLHVGNTRVHWDGGGIPEDVKVESIERRGPLLPTEPGSVISDVTTKDGRKWSSAGRDDGRDDKHPWTTFSERGIAWYNSAEIVSFTLAKVVPV